MAKITAKGKYMGQMVTVEAEQSGNEFFISIDGLEDDGGQEWFDTFMEQPPSIGGTYHPKTDTMLAAYAILQQRFFDDPREVELTVDGELEEIPYEDGVIY